MEMEGSTMSVATMQEDLAKTSTQGQSNKSNAGDLERTLIEKIGRHKQKIFVLFEQMQKEGGPTPALPTGLYEQLIEELELVAPLFDLLEHKGLSIYITSLADSFGARFPHMLTKICKRFGVKRPPSLPRPPPTDDSQLSAKKLERKRAKERLAALFSPPPMPTTPYLDEKEKREKEQEERAKELAKTPLSALLAKEQQSKQHRRRSTIGTMRFSEGLGHLHKQVLLTSPARRAPTTPTRSVAINRTSVSSAATTTTPTTTPSCAELTPSRKRKPDMESAEDHDGELLRTPSLPSAPQTPEPATAIAPTEPSSEPPQKRRRTGFAITRANPTLAPSSPAASSSAPTLAQEPQTEPRLRTSGFAITRTAPMSPLAAAASPRPRRFGAITRTPAKAGATALPRLTVRATRQLFAGPDSSSSSSATFAASSSASLFDAIVVPPPVEAASASSPPSSSFMAEC